MSSYLIECAGGTRGTVMRSQNVSSRDLGYPFSFGRAEQLTAERHNL